MEKYASNDGNGMKHENLKIAVVGAGLVSRSLTKILIHILVLLKMKGNLHTELTCSRYLIS
jgi:hypothetical protein